MAKSIQQLINEALVEKPRVRSGKYSPSSFGMCYRAQYWNRKDEPKSNPPNERTLRVFKAGKLFEDFVANLITKENDVELQVKVECDDVLGFADFVFGNEVVDSKSQHSKSFWYMAKFTDEKDIIKNKYHNWLQVMYYVRELGKEFGRLVFISKDDLCIQEYVQKLNDYWLKELEDELRQLRYIWHRDLQSTTPTIPAAEPRCEPNKKGQYWHCTYCAWFDKCKETEKLAGRKHLMEG